MTAPSASDAVAERRLAGLRADLYEAATPRPRRLVLVHGGFHGAWYWRVWGNLLAQRGWSSYAIDLPGHGDSRLPAAELIRLRIDDYARAVADAVAAVEPAPVLVGHSMGGLIAQKALERCRPAALALICSTPSAAVSGPRFELPEPDAPVEPPAGRRLQDRWFSGDVHPSFGGMEEIESLVCSESPAALRECYRHSVAVPRAKCPTLVIGSGLDPRHELGGVDRRTAALHGATCVIAAAGHDLCIEEGSGDVFERFTDWLLALDRHQGQQAHRRRGS